LAAKFGPTESDYQAVRQFAESNGLVVVATYSNRMVLNVKGSPPTSNAHFNPA